MLAGLAIGGVLFGPSLLYGDRSPQEVRPRDRGVLITIEDLDPDRERRHPHEWCTRYGQPSLMGSVHPDYRYYDDGTGEEEFSISSEVYAYTGRFLGNERKVAILWSVISDSLEKDTAWTLPDKPQLTVRRLDGLELGDESACAVGYRGERPVRFVFLCRVDLKILRVEVRGMGFEDRAEAESLLAPHVDRLREYQP